MKPGVKRVTQISKVLFHGEHRFRAQCLAKRQLRIHGGGFNVPRVTFAELRRVTWDLHRTLKADILSAWLRRDCTALPLQGYNQLYHPRRGEGWGEQESRTERDNEVPSVKCCFRHRWISRLDVVVGRPQKQPSCHGVRYGVLSGPSGKERQMVVSPRVKAPHTAGSPRVGTAPRRLYARSRPCSRIRRTRTRYSATPSHRPTQGGTGSACD